MLQLLGARVHAVAACLLQLCVERWLAAGCRGGGGASDHVSVLGNEAMLVDVIKIVTGHGATLQDSIVSDIDRIATRVPLWPDAAAALHPRVQPEAA
jgi:hypothetical protein